MVGLPEFFKQTSDEPYDRHIYRFIDSNNNSIIVESYEQVHEKWFNTPSMLKSRIEVLDKTTNKKKKI
jgi:hypothetical protein